ncbi:MAG TPA: hypothetical protein VG388_00070 [Solirubrobacteraceae bacterium]|jgi:hypothetical protein|nr:hypothetical protein [Solirubrobacteraceae bacterium]
MDDDAIGGADGERDGRLAHGERDDRTPHGERDGGPARADIRALEANLLFIGPMKRGRLARAVHAESWPDGAFDEAVRQAVRQGKIRELPLDWLKADRLYY